MDERLELVADDGVRLAGTLTRPVGPGDAAAVLAALRAAPGIDPAGVTVIGHSAGATIAIRLARADAALAGAVLLAAAARPGMEVMRDQSERIGPACAAPRGCWPGSWSAARSGPGACSSARARRRGIDGRRLPARWLREYMAYDPAADLPGVRCPVLAITGSEDLQVAPGDVARRGELVAGPFEGERGPHPRPAARPGAPGPGVLHGPAPRAGRPLVARPRGGVDRDAAGRG